MSLSNAYEEKRNFIRMKMDSPLSLTLSDRTVEGVCIDLSGTGMCIELADELKLGEQAVVHLPSQQNQVSAFNAIVRINRIMKDGDLHYYGAEILELLG